MCPPSPGCPQRFGQRFRSHNSVPIEETLILVTYTLNLAYQRSDHRFPSKIRTGRFRQGEPPCISPINTEILCIPVRTNNQLQRGPHVPACPSSHLISLSSFLLHHKPPQTFIQCHASYATDSQPSLSSAHYPPSSSRGTSTHGKLCGSRRRFPASPSV